MLGEFPDVKWIQCDGRVLGWRFAILYTGFRMGNRRGVRDARGRRQLPLLVSGTWQWPRLVRARRSRFRSGWKERQRRCEWVQVAMPRIIGLTAFMIVLLSVGVVFLLFSDDVQRFVIRSADQGLTAHIEPVKRFLRSNSGRLSIKATGVGAILMLCFLLWASISSR